MMKKVLFAACSICIAAAAAAAPLSAFAAGELAMPEYPEIYDEQLTFNNLTDFAVANDNLMIFADGSTIVHWENEDTVVYSFESKVTDVDYAEGNFYYSLDGGISSHILPTSTDELPGEQAEHDFNAPHITQTSRDLGNYIYYYNESNELIVVDKKTDETLTPLNFANAKVYGTKLYAIFDVCIYEISGHDSEKVDIRYSNYDKLTTIPAGDIPEKLNTYATSEHKPQLVQIQAGALLTQINLNDLIRYDKNGNANISVINPEDTHAGLIGEAALLLYESDNVRIVAHNMAAYIMKADGAIDLNIDLMTPVEEGTTATVQMAGEYAHSMPFISNATRTFAIAPNEELKVLCKVSNVAYIPNVLAHDFYLVENSNHEVGYVIFDPNFVKINQPPISEGDPTDIHDPSPRTDDRVKTVILVIVVIALALTGVGYIIWVVTSGKHKKPVKNKNGGEIELDNLSNENKNDINK